MWSIGTRRRLVSGLVVIAAASIVASCAAPPSRKTASASKEYFSQSEYGVAASPRVVALGGEVPKGGGRYQVGDAYKVKGKVYRPHENPNYSAVGLASW